MTGMTIEWMGTVAVAALTGWVGYAFGVRQERDRERRSRDLSAAADLVTPLRELQRLLRRFGREKILKEEVANAFKTWSTVYDNHGHRLPREWRHLARSVRAAAGTVFGGVSLVHFMPDSSRLDLGQPDAMWQDFAHDYIGYAAGCILRWGDSSREAPKRLMTYDGWLAHTGRREPHGANVVQREDAKFPVP